MVERASDYDFVTFVGEGTEITIDGNIMPKRSSSDRTLRAVDPAFINESIGELDSIWRIAVSPASETISRQIKASYYSDIIFLANRQGDFYSAYSFSGTDYVASYSPVLPQILTHFTPISSLASSRSDFYVGAPLDKSKVQNVFTDLRKFLFRGPYRSLRRCSGTAWTQVVTSNYKEGGSWNIPTTSDHLVYLSGHREDYETATGEQVTEGFTYTLTANAGTITLESVLDGLPNIIKYLDQEKVSVLAVYSIYHVASDHANVSKCAILPCTFHWVNNGIHVYMSDIAPQAASFITPYYSHYNEMPKVESGSAYETGWVDLEELYVVLARGDHTDFWSA